MLMEVMDATKRIEVVRVRALPVVGESLDEAAQRADEQMKRYGPVRAKYDMRKLASAVEGVYEDEPCLAIVQDPRDNQWGIIGEKNDGRYAVIVLNAEEADGKVRFKKGAVLAL